MNPTNIGFIGAGNMAEALIKGFINKGLIAPENIHVSAPSDRNFSKYSSLGVVTTHDNNDIVDDCPVVFLAVKPHILPIVLPSLRPDIDNNLFVSIAAGVKIDQIEKDLVNFNDPRVIRVMPNTPCLVSEGCCAFSMGSNCTKEDGEIVERLLNAVGICEPVSESIMDGICGLIGSGPAYIYAAVEAMADGAVKMGVPRNIATKFAAQTVRGASTMVLESGKHPGQLKDDVCSPGGTTIAGMHELERNGLRNALMCAVEASALKSRELMNLQN